MREKIELEAIIVPWIRKELMLQMITALVVLAFSWATLGAPPWPEERGLKAEFSLENLEKMETFSKYVPKGIGSHLNCDDRPKSHLATCTDMKLIFCMHMRGHYMSLGTPKGT